MGAAVVSTITSCTLISIFNIVSLSWRHYWRHHLSRSGSRINTDRFPKRAPKQAQAWPGGGCSETCSPGKFIFGILIFKSPLFWISESFRQDIGKFQWLLLLSKPVADIRRVCSARSRALAKMLSQFIRSYILPHHLPDFDLESLFIKSIFIYETSDRFP